MAYEGAQAKFFDNSTTTTKTVEASPTVNGVVSAVQGVLLSVKMSASAGRASAGICTIADANGNICILSINTNTPNDTRPWVSGRPFVTPLTITFTDTTAALYVDLEYNIG